MCNGVQMRRCAVRCLRRVFSTQSPLRTVPRSPKSGYRHVGALIGRQVRPSCLPITSCSKSLIC